MSAPATLGNLPVSDEAKELRLQHQRRWLCNPAIARIGKEAQIRRDRLAEKPKSAAPEALPGKFTRSKKGMDFVRNRLNALKSEERSAGNDVTSISSVVETARTEDEPFKPKSTISIAMTPSTNATFENRGIPIAHAAGEPWCKNPNSRYSKKKVSMISSWKFPFKGDVAVDSQEFQDLKKELEMINTLGRRISDMDSDEFSFKFVLTSAAVTSKQDVRSLGAGGGGTTTRPVLKVYVFSRDEDADPFAAIINDIGEDMFGDCNPTRHHLDMLIKSIGMKLELGEDVNQLARSSEDPIVKALGHMRLTTNAELSSEVLKYLYPGLIPSLMSGGRGYNRRARRLQQGMMTTIPLSFVKSVKQHVTVDSPEILAYNIIRQLSFLGRLYEAEPAEEIGTTTYEEKAAFAATSDGPPIGLCAETLFTVGSSIALRNVTKAPFNSSEPNGEKAFLSLLASASFKLANMAGPLESQRIDGKYSSLSLTFSGVDPFGSAHFKNENEWIAFHQKLQGAMSLGPDSFPSRLSYDNYRGDKEIYDDAEDSSPEKVNKKMQEYLFGADDDDDIIGTKWTVTAESVGDDEALKKSLLPGFLHAQEFQHKIVDKFQESKVSRQCLELTGDPEESTNAVYKHLPEVDLVAGPWIQHPARRSAAVHIAVLLDNRADFAALQNARGLIREWSDSKKLDVDMKDEVSNREDEICQGRTTSTTSGGSTTSSPRPVVFTLCKDITMITDGGHDDESDESESDDLDEGDKNKLQLLLHTVDAVVVVLPSGSRCNKSLKTALSSASLKPSQKFAHLRTPINDEASKCPVKYVFIQGDAAKGKMALSDDDILAEAEREDDEGRFKIKGVPMIAEAGKKIIQIASEFKDKTKSDNDRNGWDYPYTQLPLLGNAITAAMKKRKEAQKEMMEKINPPGPEGLELQESGEPPELTDQ